MVKLNYINCKNVNLEQVLDVISRDLLVERGHTLKVLDNYIYGQNAAIAIEHGASISEAREIALEKTKNASGYNCLLQKMNRVEGVNLEAYEKFVEVLNSSVSCKSLAELKEMVNEIQKRHLKNVMRKTGQTLELMHMGSGIINASKFVKSNFS